MFPGKSLQTAFCSVLFQAFVFCPLSAADVAAAVSDEILYLSTRIHLQRGVLMYTRSGWKSFDAKESGSKLAA